MTIACYIRVSSTSQKHESQRAEIDKWLTAHRIDPEEVSWFADIESGRTTLRPEFTRLQAEIFAGRIRTVVLWKLDRLSRRLQDGISILADWADRGLKVIVVTQQLEFSGALGRTLAAVLLGLAEIEWEQRRDRQAAGIALAKAKGIYRGRKPGTTKAKPQRAGELRAKGLTAPEIASALAVSLRTVFRYLKEDAGTQAGQAR